MDILPYNQAVNAYKQASSMAGEADGLLAEADSSQKASAGPSFAELLQEGMGNAKKAGYEGEIQSTKALANKTQLHELVAAVSNAELTLNTVVAVRDRMISAYQDIIKMPI